MKSDSDVWKESLDNEYNADKFDVKPAPNATLKEAKKIFKDSDEKKLEERVEMLEKRLDAAMDEIKSLRADHNKLNKKVKYIT